MRRLAVVLVLVAGLLAVRGSTTGFARSVRATTVRRVRTNATVLGNTAMVQMVGSTSGYKFTPNSLTIKSGDAVKFVMTSGGPHNVSFDPAGIPDGMAPVLQANMPNTQAPLTGPLLANPNDSYTVSFVGAKPGVYHFFCLPHQSMTMNGTITVE